MSTPRELAHKILIMGCRPPHRRSTKRLFYWYIGTIVKNVNIFFIKNKYYYLHMLLHALYFPKYLKLPLAKMRAAHTLKDT